MTQLSESPLQLISTAIFKSFFKQIQAIAPYLLILCLISFSTRPLWFTYSPHDLFAHTYRPEKKN